MNFNKKLIAIIAGVACLILAIGAMLGIYNRNQDTPVAGSKEITIVVVHGDESEKTFVYQTDEEYLEGVLVENELVEGTDSEWGLYIITVDGETADDSQQQWWCITKDGEMTTTGASETVISDGEQYELTLIEGY